MSSTAIATSAIIISASAARDAKEAKCAALIDGYEHATATTEQQQEYADCIDMLHPDQITGTEVIAIKVVIVCALIGAAIGAFRGDYADERFVHALFGAIIGVLAPVLMAAIIWAIHFLFTA